MSPARSRALLVGALVVLVAAVLGLALFQPWKLWVDDTVSATAPAGAVPIAAAGTTSSAGPTTTAGAPPTTAAPSTQTTPVAPATTSPAASAAAAGDMTETTTEADDMASDDTAAETTAAPPVPVPTQFVSLDHGTSGGLLLLADAEGRRFVRFEELRTDNGPDLKVYLSTNPVDGPEGAFDDDFVDLGRLQGNVGSQNYELPADVDLSRFRSVVIWCDRFNSAFGAAPIGA